MTPSCLQFFFFSRQLEISHNLKLQFSLLIQSTILAWRDRTKLTPLPKGKNHSNQQIIMLNLKTGSRHKIGADLPFPCTALYFILKMCIFTVRTQVAFGFDEVCPMLNVGITSDLLHTKQHFSCFKSKEMFSCN